MAWLAPLLLAGPASGQDASEAETRLRGCLGTAEPGSERACIGAYSRRCAAEAPSGETTLGLSDCARAEADGWDRLLNEAYAEIVVLSRRRASADGEAIALAPLEAALREAQRAWIAFRDADCEHEYALWGDGSQRQVAGAVCLLERTAARVFELRGKLEQMRRTRWR